MPAPAAPFTGIDAGRAWPSCRRLRACVGGRGCCTSIARQPTLGAPSAQPYELGRASRGRCVIQLRTEAGPSAAAVPDIFPQLLMILTFCVRAWDAEAGFGARLLGQPFRTSPQGMQREAVHAICWCIYGLTRGLSRTLIGWLSASNKRPARFERRLPGNEVQFIVVAYTPHMRMKTACGSANARCSAPLTSRN